MTVDSASVRRAVINDPIRLGREHGPVGDRLVSVAELQHALRELRRSPPLRESEATTVSSSPRARDTEGLSCLANIHSNGRGGTVRRAIAVIAAHPGAGASTVALALADAIAATGEPVRLIDGAAAAWSGLAAVATAELGVDRSGWRRGRRGERVELHRRSDVDCAPDVALLEDIVAAAEGALILDLGWPVNADLLGGFLPRVVSDALPVVVCGASVPGVRHAERVLASLWGNAVVAAVGRTRWPRVVTASCGTRLLDARNADRVVSIPVVPWLTVTGLTADSLPGPVLAGGRLLANRLHQLSAATALPASRDEEPGHAG